ncbi:DUF4124 domain-containing protein [Cupriavidus cauae]|uniref:DUF4124 domain-containing protein n=1 Tax=Cupriavidus cauae TaxID=2608999 RepID=UPI00295869DE|nr:DUF4124 domain-containing protein [Cupriavidus cauae]
MTATLSSSRPPHRPGAEPAPPPRTGASAALLLGIAAGVAAALGPLGASPAAAQSAAQSAPNGSEIYVCSGPKGVPEYRNGNGGKGCKRLDLPDVLTVPVTRQAARGVGGGGGGGVNPAPIDGATAANFPRIDAATQRRRDGERRAVLEEELRSEQAKLATLRAQFNEGQPERQGDERNYQRYLDRTAALREDIARSEANAAALRRELANLKD